MVSLERAWLAEPRHLDHIVGVSRVYEPWLPRERKKTVSVAIVLCLNIGVDPPDVVKPQPAARLECWLDPLAMSQQKALEMIGTTLQKQYERWQPRARYKLSLDPTVEDVKKLCISLRRNAKEERVLFNYNGHGVPKPTKNGEIWVFNKSYTQYIPLSIFDLQTWMGAPSIYVYDCNNAGVIVEKFMQFAQQHAEEYRQQQRAAASVNGSAAVGADAGAANSFADADGTPTAEDSTRRGGPQEATSRSRRPAQTTDSQMAGLSGAFQPPPSAAPLVVPTPAPPNFSECIQLASCGSDEILPMNSELPGDLFTSCLTTPIKVAVLWYLLQNQLVEELPMDIIDKIPGQLTDRRTMLGELNWIFTAITDTIAWNTLPRELFQKLFRQDLLVASLFRNFLLANRVMRAHHCTPVSHPALPDTHQHPLWAAWDFALDCSLAQLPSIFQNQAEYIHSTFFTSQLTAFDVWLNYGYDSRTPPQQLPIVLQVLLSQVHRFRALELLGRFLDLGSWAVSLALSVGIFPYVLKLLQSSARDLRPLLAFIWAKILAVDTTCQAELVKDNGHQYFLQILNDQSTSIRDKIISAFVLSCVCTDCRAGQESLIQGHYTSICMGLLTEDLKCSMLKLWLIIALGKLWMDYDPARWQGIRLLAYEKVYEQLKDPVPEVRAAAVYALGTLLSNACDENEHAAHIDQNIVMTLIKEMPMDGSSLVRKELVVALHWFVLNFQNQFVTIAADIQEEETVLLRQRSQDLSASASYADLPLDLSDSGGKFGSSTSVAHRRQSSVNNEVQGGGEGGLLVSISSVFGPGVSTITRSNSARNLAFSTSTGGPMTPSPPLNPLTPLMSPRSSLTVTSLAGIATTSTSSSPIKAIFKGKGGPGALGARPSAGGSVLRELSNSYANVWRTFLELQLDPSPDVADLVRVVVDHVNGKAVKLLGQRYLERERTISESSTDGDVSAGSDSGLASSERKSPGAPRPPGKRTLSAERPKFVIGSPPLHSLVANPALGKMRTSPSQPTMGTITEPAAAYSSSPENTQRLSINGEHSSIDSPHSARFIVRTKKPFMPGPAAGQTSSSQASPVPSSSTTPASTVAVKRTSLISTNFVPWLAKSFAEPIIERLDRCGSGESRKASVQGWGREALVRNQHLARAHAQALRSGDVRLESQLFVSRNQRLPLFLSFHPLLPLLLVGERDRVTVWHYEECRTLWKMSNRHASHDLLANMHFVNPLSVAYLLTATHHGHIKVWKPNFEQQTGTDRVGKLLAGWNATADLTRSRSPYTVTQWEQSNGSLLISGDVKIVRIWDVNEERKVSDLALAGSDGAFRVQCLTADCSLAAVGCSDGSVRLLDRRLPLREGKGPAVMTLRSAQHTVSPIVGVELHSAGAGVSKLIGGSQDGRLRIWEPRMYQEPVFTANVGAQLVAVKAHGVAEVVACGTAQNSVTIFDFSGSQLGQIRYHEGFMGQKLGGVQSLAFHPYRAYLGYGGLDSVVAVYGLDKAVV